MANYDGWYVALAEAPDLPLATLDVLLTKAEGPKCRFPDARVGQVDWRWRGKQIYGWSASGRIAARL